MRKTRLGINLLFSMAIGVGCGGSSSPADDMGGAVDMGNADQKVTQSGVNFNKIVQVMVANSCTSAPCHSSQRHEQGLDLETDPYAALVGTSSTESLGTLRVAPCDPDKSFLLTKLANNSFGARMPDGLPPLPAAQIQAISDWIARGALKDEPDTVTGNTCTLDGGTP
jgi:hypothetical protein